MNATERKNRVREIANRCTRIVEWDDEDGVFIGSAPPLLRQCCHGATEEEVFARLTQIINEWAEDMADGVVAIPAGLEKKTFSGKILLRLDPELHKRAALKAFARGESLNRYIASAIS